MPAPRRPLTAVQTDGLSLFAARQGGVVTRAQALGLALSASQISTLVRRGDWADGGAGLLADPARQDDLHLVARRLMGLERRAVISHASAGVLLGLPYVDRPPLPTLTVERGHRGEPGIYVARLSPGDVTHHEGLPITTPARALVDLLRTSDNRPAAQVLADGALGVALAWDEVEAVLAACTGWPGIRQAREAWQHADARVESPLESRARVWMRDGGLPEPEPQVVLGDAHGRTARVDFFFRAQQTIVEADGRLKYDDPNALWAEKNREDWLRDLGFEVVRATWADGRDGGADLVRRVLRAFDRRAQRAA